MNKKGFTLIELLAVIVILAIIAVIATPMVLNTIDDVRKGAAKSSATTYMKELETEVIKSMMTTSPIKSGKYKVGDITVDVKGDAPTEGYVCVASDGTVEKASILLNDYVISYDGKEATTTDKEKVEEIDCGANVVYEDGTAIYFNPNTGEKCDAASVQPTYYTVEGNDLLLYETTSGCMKWYTFNDNANSSTVNMILDHNTSNGVDWNSNGNTVDDMSTVLEQLNSDTSDWHSSVKSTIRLISANEVAQIADNNDFNSDDYETSFNIGLDSGALKYLPWLYDNMYACAERGCENEDNNDSYLYVSDVAVVGPALDYWTASFSKQNSLVWQVSTNAYLSGLQYDPQDYSSFKSGIRPVITVSKALLK